MPIERPPFFHEAEVDGILREDVAQDEISFGAATLFHACNDVCECDGRRRRDDEVEMLSAQMFVDCALIDKRQENVRNAFAHEVYPEERERFHLQNANAVSVSDDFCFFLVSDNRRDHANIVSVAGKFFDERSIHIGASAHIRHRNRKEKNLHGERLQTAQT